MEQRDLQEAAIEDRKRRRRRRIVSTVVTFLFAILLLLAIIAAIVAVLMAVGGNRLKSKSETNRPSFTTDEMTEEEKAAAAQAGAEEIKKQEEEKVVWEEGWVRHDGKVYAYNEDIMTFLVMGIDREGTVKESKNSTDGGQSDALFLVVLNPDDKTIDVVGINRDTMTEVNMYGYTGEGESKMVIAQITVQHGFGDGKEKSCELTVEAVSKLFYDLPIHGYAAINMGAVAKLNDAVGGVTVTVPEDLTKVKSGWTQGAEITLKGKDAYRYVRWRDMSIFESSRSRLARQKQYLAAFMQQAKKATKEDITLPLTLYGELSKYMVTDVTVDEVAYLASQLMDYTFDATSVHTLEGTTKMGEKFEEFYPDPEAFNDLMIEVFYEEVNPE